jgi:hypothetical protein
MNDNKIALRIISGLILVAAIAGIAFFAFRAGVAQGSPVTIQAPSGQTAPAPYPYPYYGWGMPFHPWGFGFGCFGPLLALFLLFIALRAFRFAFWGPRWGWGGWGHHRYGPWGRQWENGVPPMFDEWHKKAHNVPEGGGETPQENKE